jgi:hypothetical protein
MNEQFLKLVAALTTPYPHYGDPIEDAKFSEFQTDCLKKMWELRQHPPALNFLAAINHKDETNEWRLREAHRLAKQVLPVLLRQKQKVDSEPEMTRFQRQRNDLDPFVDEHTPMTRDAFAGQVSADTPRYRTTERGYLVDEE